MLEMAYEVQMELVFFKLPNPLILSNLAKGPNPPPPPRVG